MRYISNIILLLLLTVACKEVAQQPQETNKQPQMNASDILSNPDYLAISYGGYRGVSRDQQPTIKQLKEDLRIMHAMGIRVLRTYNMQLPHATNVVKAIAQLKEKDAQFEMYVMLGAWIDCKNAWTGLPVDHHIESEQNADEIARAVALTNEYPDIVKVIAVGNEAMVKWATSYYVQPDVILKWVTHLQELKTTNQLAKDTWITSSDNFASWGGGDTLYHVPALEKLIKAVDYVSVHTYPMHDTHYNPVFWGIDEDEKQFSKKKQIAMAMSRSRDYAISQYDSVVRYMHGLGVKKQVHIGETGWASYSNEHYGHDGSKATDEYKSGLYYQLMREWSKDRKIACFYFEAFDEQWKDAANPQGSENHFGLINLKSQAKYPLWSLVDRGIFDSLKRDGKPLTKTYGGNLTSLLNDVQIPPVKKMH